MRTKIGQNISGVERMINARLGVRRRDDTLPDRWFDEEIQKGTFEGEKLDREAFQDLLSRYYRLSELDEEGHPTGEFHRRLASILGKFHVEVTIPSTVRDGLPEGGRVVVQEPVATLGELTRALDAMKSFLEGYVQNT